MTSDEKFQIARHFFSKLEGDIQHEKSYHEGNAGAQKALKRIEREVDKAITRLADLDDKPPAKKAAPRERIEREVDKAIAKLAGLDDKSPAKKAASPAKKPAAVHPPKR